MPKESSSAAIVAPSGENAIDKIPVGEPLIASSGYSRAIRFWRVSDGALLAQWDKETGWGPDPVLPMAASRDGLHVVYGRGDATLVSATNPLP